MKLTTITSSLLAFCTLGQAALNLTYIPETDPQGRVVLGENVRIAWESDRTYDLHLEMVKKLGDKKHWPSGWRLIETMFMKLRLNEGKGEYLYNIPVGKGQRTSVGIKDGDGLQYVNHTTWFSVIKNEIAPKDGFKEQTFSA
ncbi:unnamed protein product [Aureobasidium uvarum]|uniref:Uncharacterized protein n=1 Tax=Aureobasidium uvarum TaxID=2773716 RepID=A0A9N8PY45_9PEZI|nr:unnamed protein product [Aureobasidium uvarum]